MRRILDNDLYRDMTSEEEAAAEAADQKTLKES